MAPCFLPGVDVPRLDFADMVGAWRDIHLIGRRGAPSASRRFHDAPDHHRAKIFLRRDVHHARFRIERTGLPVLSAVPGWAKAGELSDPRPVVWVDLRSFRLGIEVAENVLLYVRLAIDEIDLVAGALEKIQVAAACEVDESLDRLAVAPESDKHRGRGLGQVTGCG